MPTLTLQSIKNALTDYSILDKVPRISFLTFAQILHNAHSPAYPEALECWKAITKRGVDPALALAQFKQESSFGTAGIAVNTHSWGNIRRSGNFVSYRNWESGAADYADLISGPLYAGNNQYNSARKMPFRWAPASDGNNPTNYGNNLVAFIAQFINLDHKRKVTQPVATENRATLLADAINSRVQYIENLLNSHNMDPASYTEHIAAIRTYTAELLGQSTTPTETPATTTSVEAPTAVTPAPVVDVTPEPAPAPVPPDNIQTTEEFTARYGYSPQEYFNRVVLSDANPPNLPDVESQLGSAQIALDAFGDQNAINAGNNTQRIQELATAVNLVDSLKQQATNLLERQMYARQFLDGILPDYRSYLGTTGQQLAQMGLIDTTAVPAH